MSTHSQMNSMTTLYTSSSHSHIIFAIFMVKNQILNLTFNRKGKTNQMRCAFTYMVRGQILVISEKLIKYAVG